jgi:hypothetical protein
MTICCHHLLYNTTTINESDGIVAVTFFAIKPLKKTTASAIDFFCSKTIKAGGKSYLRLLLLLKHKEEGDGSKPLSPSSPHHHHRNCQFDSRPFFRT